MAVTLLADQFFLIDRKQCNIALLVMITGLLYRPPLGYLVTGLKGI